MARLDSIYDVSDKFLGELKAWLEPWFLTRGRTATFGRIDSTENVGDTFGVHSGNLTDDPEPAGYVLTSLGDRGSSWSPGNPPTFNEIVTGDEFAACLLGYWRLGDLSGDFLDSNPFLSAVDLTVVSGTNPLTRHVTGAISANQDDGAVELNGFWDPATGGTSGDYLAATTSRFNFASSASTYSVACWARPKTHNLTGYDNPPAIACGVSVGALNQQGWTLEYAYDSELVIFRRRQDGSLGSIGTSASMLLDNWSFVVGTYNGAGGGLTSIYVNGVLANTSAGTVSVSGAGHIHVGHSQVGPVAEDFFFGDIDELAIFQCVLTQDQVDRLYAAQSIINVAINQSTVYVTVTDGPPTDFVTPFVFDQTAVTGGLYGWTGSAYVQVGPAL